MSDIDWVLVLGLLFFGRRHIQRRRGLRVELLIRLFRDGLQNIRSERFAAHRVLIFYLRDQRKMYQLSTPPGNTTLPEVTREQFERVGWSSNKTGAAARYLAAAHPEYFAYERSRTIGGSAWMLSLKDADE